MRLILGLALLFVVPSLGIASLGFSLEASPGTRPNVVVILSDDQGWGDLSLHGNSNLETPNIDRLAREGAMFERFYVSPLCAPTRAEFLTGRYHPRTGVHGVTTGAERLNLDEFTIAEAFRAANYRTAVFGKWHNGSQYPYHPLGRGFEDFYGFTSGHWGIYFDPPLEHNGKIVTGKGYITDDLTNHAIDFIKQHKDEPFFCYVAYNTPHSPFQVPDRFFQKFSQAELIKRYEGAEKEDIETTRAALAMCENIDWNVGRILDALHQTGLDQRTIVVYFSDNGPNSWRWNGGMRGRKGSTDEGGVRVPCVIRWPGQIPSGLRVAQIAGAIDLFPTLTALAGIKVTPPQPLDGMDLSPLLRNQPVDWPDRLIFSHQAGRVSVRNQRYILDAQGRLYDLQSDPGQAREITKEAPAIAERLKQAVSEFRASALPQGPDDRPFPVGYREFPITFLPARDGVPHGNIARSASAPNCSFFTNWLSVDDAITWDIEVHTAGDYEVCIYYTCREKDVGVELEVSFGDVSVTTQINEAFDPPLHGQEFDRVPRKGESYVKDFKPLPIGVLQLPAGRGLLKIRATKIPGEQAIDLRMITLTLK
ncbi:MAG: arylsulfatase [Thermogutta sp.]